MSGAKSRAPPAKESRIAPGAPRCHRRGNPFLQYFLGLHEYLRKELFDLSMMVHFRKRIRPEMLEKINLAIIYRARSQAESHGKLIIDASCTPADLELLNDAHGAGNGASV